MVVSNIGICLELVPEHAEACEVEGADEEEEWVGFEWDGAHLAQRSCEESLKWHCCLLMFWWLVVGL